MTALDHDHDYYKYSEQYARDPSFTFTWSGDLIGNDGVALLYLEDVEVDVSRHQGCWLVDEVRLRGHTLRTGGSIMETGLYFGIVAAVEADQKDIDEWAASKGVDL